jgi:MYXO-CTERM domain-containing protein
MFRHSPGTALAAALLLLPAGAALGQNTTDPVTSTPPPTTTERPTTTTAPPVTTTEPARTETPAPRSAPEIVTVPVPVPTAPPPTIELQDQPYPNGFADPNAPFGNDMSVQVRQQESGGFPWGLLGLLGLAGLLGLRRPDRHRHVVHSERYDDGRPPRV